MEDIMRLTWCVPVVAIAAIVLCGFGQQPQRPPHDEKKEMPQAIFKNYKDLKWEKILPDLGDSSPEICILQVDPKTKAAKLLIRTPKAIHIRKHWHSANE